MDIFIKGLIIGVCIAAPVGPIGILCIRRTMAHGKWVGFVSGLGAATADGLYGLMAALGLSVVTSFLIGQQVWLQLLGSAFLLYIGVKTFRSTPAHEAAKANGAKPFIAYISTLFLTITNPMTILSFIAIFTGAGVLQTGTGGVYWIVLGVFLGSACWWLLLSYIADSLSRKMQTGALVYVNYVSGIILVVFAVYNIVTTF